MKGEKNSARRVSHLERSNLGDITDRGIANVVEEGSQEIRPGVARNVHGAVGSQNLSGSVTHHLHGGLDRLQKLKGGGKRSTTVR